MTDFTATPLIIGSPIFESPRVSGIGVRTKIFKALLAQLEVVVSRNPIAISYPGIAFAPVGGIPYLAVSFVPSATVAFDVISTNDYSGIFQVVIFWPVQRGLFAPLAEAASVRNAFPRGSSFRNEGVNVLIIQPPYILPPRQEPSWFCVPINIPYRAFSEEN